MTKTLAHYLSLPYTIEVKPDRDAGGFVARIRELKGCMTQADTWDALWPLIQEAQEGWLEVALEEGFTIPEPDPQPIQK